MPPKRASVKTQSGTIIILNGTSSSGKTSLVKVLQDTFTDPYLEAGIDKFIFMLPKRYLDRPLWDDVLGKASHAGETGNRLVASMHQAIETLSLSGMNVIVDHVLVERPWWQDCAMRFSHLPAYLVGVHCPLKVLEQREKSRGNRTLGQARAQYEIVHGLGIYDVEVDTSRLTPVDCARVIYDRVTSDIPPSALKEIRERLNEF
jgi:chloramphenicol 3-O phosphotransferase